MTAPIIQDNLAAAAPGDGFDTTHFPPPPLASQPPPSSSPTPHQFNTRSLLHPHPPSRRVPTSSSRSRRSRRHSLPFVFPPPFQSNPSSTSLIPSTAEGRPIPLDDSTAAHRTSALRELNRSQPVSRHRYTKSSGAPSAATGTTTGTYSQPVIVRTYSGPPPSSAGRSSARRRVPSSSNVSAPPTNASNWRLGRNGVVVNMARSVGKKKAQPQADAKLPPLEAFSFKSIVADMQQDIGADLDRIAEICARSRYSLSNQYEVHVAPHGSGAGFLASAHSRDQMSGGPTLQAVGSDDERGTTRYKRRKGAMQRRSAAYSTLETIMSSSQSSDDDKSKKKSAADIAEEVRGRAARKASGGSAATLGLLETQVSNGLATDHNENLVRRKSISFATAVMDSTRTQQQSENTVSPRGSGNSLLSEPAQPKTSRSHLEIRTSPEDAGDDYTHEAPQPSEAVVSESMASAAISSPEQPRAPPGLLSGLSAWIPWRGGSPAIAETASSEQKGDKGRGKSYAEGTLRDLLRTTESSPDRKGKAIDRST